MDDVTKSVGSGWAWITAVSGGKAVRAAGIIIACVLLTIAGFQYLTPLAALEGQVSDRIQAAAREAPDEQHRQISIIAITEKTLARLPYRSPVDRGFLADVLEAIQDASVRSVAFDILFDQPTESAKDQRLAAAIRNFPAPVIVAWADARAGLTKKQQKWLESFIEASGAERGGAGLAFDNDAVVRRHEPFDSTTENRSLPAALAQADERRGAPIAWLGKTKDDKEPFQVLPAHSLKLMAKRPAIIKRWLNGRVVLIGADLPQTDRHQTTLSADPAFPATIPGVVVHAHIVAQLLDQRSLQSLGNIGLVGLLSIASLIGVAVGFSGRAFWLQGLAGLIFLAGWTGVTLYLGKRYSIILPLTPPLFCFAAAFSVSASLDALRHRREKAFVRNAFSHYVSPLLVNALMADPKQLQLGGERRVMSFLFTDIAGFTSMSESLPPTELTRLLNSYLDGMSEIVLAHGGALDKFIGDAVVALFGAPVPQEDDARRAFTCAIELDVFAEKFRQAHAEKGMGVTRIGVHRGEATVGNFGGKQRFDYTAMGDAMNTAARLEGANKAFGTRIAMSKEVLEAAGAIDAPLMQEIGNVILKGRRSTVQVFTPLADMPESALECYNEALRISETRPVDAVRQFQELEATWPDNPLIQFHARRIEAGETGTTFELKEK